MSFYHKNSVVVLLGMSGGTSVKFVPTVTFPHIYISADMLGIHRIKMAVTAKKGNVEFKAH